MKVAMIAPYPRSTGKPHGGVEAAVESLAWAISELGIDLRILDPYTGYSEVPDGTNHSLVRLPRMRSWHVLIPHPPSRLAVSLREWGPDLLHVHLGAQLCASHSPSVLTIHGLPHIDSAHRNRAFGQRLRSAVLQQSFMRGVRNANAVVAISPETQQIAHEAGVPSVSIPNPISEEFFSVTRDPGDDLVAVGHVSPLKNQQVLIKAFGRYVGEGGLGDLVLVGAIADDRYFDTCVREAISFSSRVRFTGPLPRSGVSELLASARASISASRRETSSVAIAESFAANCPVISFDVGTARAQIRDARYGEVLARNSPLSDLTAAMHRVGREGAEGNLLRDSVGTQRPSAVAAKTASLYRTMLSENQRHID